MGERISPTTLRSKIRDFCPNRIIINPISHTQSYTRGNRIESYPF